MLSRYNIELTEGPWSENAQARASIKAGRVQAAKGCCSDTAALSAGTFNQRSENVSFISTDASSGYDQGTVYEQPVQSNQVQEIEPTEADSLPSNPGGRRIETELDALETKLERGIDSSSRPIVDPKAKGFLSGIVDRLNPRARP